MYPLGVIPAWQGGGRRPRLPTASGVARRRARGRRCADSRAGRAYCESANVPGYVACVYHDGAQIVAAYGLANVVTGAPMREGTGFVFGSITKVLTATLVLQQMERGTIDLAERVIKYLLEYRLTTLGRPKRSASGIH